MGLLERFKGYFRKHSEPEPKIDENTPKTPRDETGMMQWGPRRGSGGW